MKSPEIVCCVRNVHYNGVPNIAYLSGKREAWRGRCLESGTTKYRVAREDGCKQRLYPSQKPANPDVMLIFPDIFENVSLSNRQNGPSLSIIQEVCHYFKIKLMPRNLLNENGDGALH